MVSYLKYLDDLAKKEKDAQEWAYEKFLNILVQTIHHKKEQSLQSLN